MTDSATPWDGTKDSTARLHAARIAASDAAHRCADEAAAEAASPERVALRKAWREREAWEHRDGC